jgi:hypothetical protein
MGDTRASRRLGQRELSRRAGQPASLRNIMPRTNIFSTMNTSFAQMIKRIRATNISLAAMAAAVKKSAALEAIRSLGLKGLGAKILGALSAPLLFARKGLTKISSAWTASAAANATAVSSRGLLSQAGQQMKARIFKDPTAGRKGMGRILAPLDVGRQAYDKSMHRQGVRAIAEGRHSGKIPKGQARAGRTMNPVAVGKQMATGLGKGRALSRGIFTVFALAIKKAILFALGAFTGAGLVFTIPLILAFGAAFMANPEQFKKYMMETFKAPLEALKKTWDDTTAVFRRLFAAIKSGGDGEGSKFVEWAGRITGIMGTALAGAFQAVLTIVNFLFEGLHVLFLLMSGEGEAASVMLSKAFLRLRVGMAEVFASMLELLAKVPGISQIFGGRLEGAAASIRSWASETRTELERADIIPNAVATLQLMEGKQAKALRKTRDARKENLDILADLVKFSIIEQETIDRLKDSVNDLSTAFKDTDADSERILTLREEAIIRENNLDAALNEIAAMEMLTDEQKTQLAYAVMQQELDRAVAERNAANEDLLNKANKVNQGGVEKVNLEKEKGLALVYLEAQMLDAMRRGDQKEVDRIRDQVHKVNQDFDQKIQYQTITEAFNQQAVIDAQAEVDLLEQANKHIAMKVQLNDRQQAQYDALKEEMEEMLELEKDRLNFFKSAMGEVMSDIGSAVDRVVNKQTEAIKRLFDEIEDVTNDYFSNFSEEFQKSIDGLRDAVIEQAEEEEAYIDYLADLAIQKIEDEREMEKKLEQERQLYFSREKARIDFLAGRRTGAVQVEEAMARGDVGQAAVLQIRMQTDAQQYYADQLQENEDRLMQLREEARDNEIERINAEREVAKEIVGIRRDAAEQDLDNAQEIAMTEMELAQEAARERMDEAKGAIDKMIESEGFLRSEFLREWNRVTPATEEEYRRHLGRLEDFMNESDERMVELTNKIKDEMGQDLAEISQSFGLTVTEVVGDLDIAMQAAGFAVGVFGQDLARTTANTLLSVLTAFEGFNVGLEQGYANAVALAEAFFEMFQRSVDQAVEWARGLADRMVAEDMKWKQAGEEAGRQFREEFERQMNELVAEARRTAQRIKSIYAEEGLDSLMGPTGYEHFRNLERQSANVLPAPVRADEGRTATRPGVGGTTLTNPGAIAGMPAVQSRDYSQSWMRNDRSGGSPFNGFMNFIGGIFQVITRASDFVGLSALGAGRGAYYSDWRDEFMPGEYSSDGWRVAPEIRHSGGLIGAKLKSNEVPAILQKGEYVIQRSAVSALGVDFLNSLNSSSAMFSVPEIRNLNVARPAGDSTVNSTNTYNLSFNVDGGNIDEQQLAQKVVFEIKKMERAGGGGRRV